MKSLASIGKTERAPELITVPVRCGPHQRRRQRRACPATAGAAARLLVSTPFGSLNNNGNILSGTPFVVEVVAADAYGNVASPFNGTVTLALTNNSTGATLGGTVTSTAVNGVATFSGVTINNPGSGYVLQATSTNLTSGTSPAFSVTHDRLVVTSQPPGTISAGTGVPFALTVARSPIRIIKCLRPAILRSTLASQRRFKL